jgi:peroxiredoxin
LIRNEQVGKPIDFNDNDSNENPIDVSRLKNRLVILAFYSPNAPGTSDMFNSLKFTYELIKRTDVQVIAIAVEKARSEKFESGFDANWISIESSIDDTSKIFLQCPVTHVPYFVLIDRNGIVDSLNVPVSQLKTRIEALEASAAKAGR